jgi:hypothetical protein
MDTDSVIHLTLILGMQAGVGVPANLQCLSYKNNQAGICRDLLFQSGFKRSRMQGLAGFSRRARRIRTKSAACNAQRR